jgi:[CysO sulfur-carrier protein]-S-L-cysteine hydrolase
MLMAEQLGPGHFRIVDFSLDAFSGSHTRFRRDPKTHQKVLDEFFRTLPAVQLSRRMALASVVLSAAELRGHQSMTDIVENGNSTITFAVLLIVFAHGFCKEPKPTSAGIRPKDSMDMTASWG